MTKKPWIFLAALPLILTPVHLSAAIIYNNGPIDKFDADEATRFIESEDFKLTSAGAIGQVDFFSLESTANSYSGSLYWAIAADNSGIPGAIVAGGATTAAVTRTLQVGQGYLGGQVWLNEFLIPTFNAAAGTEYWLEIHNGALSHISNDGFYWATTSGPMTGGTGPNTGQEMLLVGGPNPWVDNGNEHAFYLSSAVQQGVPEPGTMALLGAGLLGLAARARGRRK